MKPESSATRLGIWFYDAEEEKKRPEDSHQLVHGRVVMVPGARFAVWKLRWNGTAWQRLRRVSGPLRKAQADARLAELGG